MTELVKKVLKAMGEIGAIEKDGRNEFQRYDYVSHAGIMKRLQPQLVKHGVLIYPSGMEVIAHSEHKDRKGNPAFQVILKTEYTVTDGAERFTVYGVGEGVDSGDKASYKAQTGAHKYALKALLSLPDENDAEANSPELSVKEEAKRDFPNSGQVSSQKAGKNRAMELENLEHVMGDMKEKVFEKYGITRWEDLDKLTADKMITKYTEIAEGK